MAIACSLIHNPCLVHADDPTASLDTERSFQVVQCFADLIHEQNKVGFLVTHDLLICRYVDTVIQMKDGKVINVIKDPLVISALASSEPGLSEAIPLENVGLSTKDVPLELQVVIRE